MLRRAVLLTPGSDGLPAFTTATRTSFRGPTFTLPPCSPITATSSLPQEEISRMAAVQTKVDEVKNVMVQNVQSVRSRLEAGEKLAGSSRGAHKHWEGVCGRDQ